MNSQAKIRKRFLQKVWQENEHQKHIQRVLFPRRNNDKSPPKLYKHLLERKKQEQQTEDRFTEIEKANRILLERVYKLTLQPPPRDGPFQKESLNKTFRRRFSKKRENENLVKY